MLELIAINYSPWSEKARWALDHYGVDYEETPYLAMLGELALRKRLGRWRGKLSVPLLIAEGEVIGDSFKIARHLEEKHGKDHPLFPSASRDEIQLWNERSEAGLAAGRAMTTQRVLESPEARREAMPPMPKMLAAPLMAPLTRLGVGFMRRKYGYSDKLDAHRATLTDMLCNLQNTLSDDRPFLLGDTFCYADICMAVGLQFVRPVTDEYIKLGSATRKAWTDDQLSQEFSDLLLWRDRVYESHRRH